MSPTSKPAIRLATRRDLAALLRLRRDYCRFDGIAFRPLAARRAMLGLMGRSRLGRILILSVAGRPAGYVALGYCYSLEFDGRDGIVDELYLEPGLRGHGHGTRLLRAALAVARRDGARAFHLETGRANRRAQRFYAKHGFRLRSRFVLMSRSLVA